MMASKSFLLHATARELQRLLSSGETTSVEIIEAYLEQIGKHNHDGLKLNALLAVRPKDQALAQARRLDDERKAGRIRSKLHGVPIIIKDAIVTDPSLGMITSAGSYAIASLTANRNATIVDMLLEAGLIIIGKGNMTEFCGLKSNDTKIGWSAYGGQTMSPYRRDGLEEDDQPWCGGSSSGPAVGIAAGFSPLGIGTETTGSNVFPASVNGLYGMTLTHNSVPSDGVFKLGDPFDRIGIMAADPVDLQYLSKILLPKDKIQDSSSLDDADESLERFNIGILKSSWGIPDDDVENKWGLSEVTAKYNGVAKQLEAKGANIVFPFDAPTASTLEHGEQSLHTVAYHEFPSEIERFIMENFDPCSVIKNLADVIAWNEQHADQALPKPYTTQTELTVSLNSTMTDAEHDEALKSLQRIAREESLAKVMAEQNVDIALSASDATLVSFGGCAGWPIATVPLGNLEKNGQPWGMFALARAGREDLLLKFMAAFKGTFPPIQKPTKPFE